MRILYVEDNESLRETVRMMLEADRREVTGVGSAEAAMKLLAQSHYDLLITDVSLPGRSGIELARSARSSAPDLVVVLMSGYDYLAKYNEFGPRSAVLGKPFEPDELEELLRRFERDGASPAAAA